MKTTKKPLIGTAGPHRPFPPQLCRLGGRLAELSGRPGTDEFWRTDVRIVKLHITRLQPNRRIADTWSYGTLRLHSEEIVPASTTLDWRSHLLETLVCSNLSPGKITTMARAIYAGHEVSRTGYRQEEIH